MGRWESTKKVHPFKGVYLYDNDRVEELQKAKQKQIYDKDTSELTITDVQNLCDYYGIPMVQAQKRPRSYAEIIGGYDRYDMYDVAFMTDDDEFVSWINNYDPNDGMTKEEYFRAMKKELPRRGKQSDSQLIKLAEQCGVGWDYSDDGELVFSDERFTNIMCTVIYANKKELNHLSPAQQRKLIKEKYIQIMRDPGLDGQYELCKSIILEHYNVDVTVNDEGNPIGKYKKFLNTFNEVYDGFMREGKFPELERIILELDMLFYETEMENEAKKAAASRKRTDTRRRNRYFKEHPIRKKLYDLGVKCGINFVTDVEGHPHPSFVRS